VSAGDRIIFVGESASTAPTGRAARLWRVLVELAVSVEEALEAEADRLRGALETGSPPPPPVAARSRAVVPRQIESWVIEFDDAYTHFVEGMDRLPSETQLMALQAVDRQLEGMVRARDAALWTERALCEDARWSEARRLAVCVIQAFEWPERRVSLVAAGTAREAAGSLPGSGSARTARRES
jgi:hypothetical protein